MNNLHKEEIIKATNITIPLGKLIKIFRQKRPILASQDSYWDRNNAPVHSTTTVHTNLAAKSIQMICHRPFFCDMSSIDFFMVPKTKLKLPDISMVQDSFKDTWEGAIKTLAKDDFTTALLNGLELCKKCNSIGSDHAEKSYNIIFFYIFKCF